MHSILNTRDAGDKKLSKRKFRDKCFNPGSNDVLIQRRNEFLRIQKQFKFGAYLLAITCAIVLLLFFATYVM